jgi:hypothetical protein
MILIVKQNNVLMISKSSKQPQHLQSQEQQKPLNVVRHLSSFQLVLTVQIS